MNGKPDARTKNSDNNLRAKRQVHIKVREFQIPPVRHGVVLGRKASIGCYAIRKALHLLMATPFVHIELDDEVISDIIVRQAVLRRFPRQELIVFVLEQVKPIMGEEEILHLEIDTEVLFDARMMDRERTENHNPEID
ncbi:MAG: hypothetical protein ACPW60_03960 [Methylohalobius sp. ZOD2]